MTLSKKGKYWYGTEIADTRTEIVRFSRLNEYEAVKFAQANCSCGGVLFRLDSDEEEGAAKRTCVACGAITLMGDSAEYAAEASFDDHSCMCGHAEFALTSAVALYPDSKDVRWYYIGCRCPKCSLVGVFAHWKCEFEDADAFLAAT
jgi:hypothetical protein